MKCVTMTLMRAMGRNKATAYTNVIACWLFGFPLVFMLCFMPGQFGLMGLWAGMACTWIVSASIFTVLMYRTDWNAIGKDAAAASADGAAASVQLTRSDLAVMEKGKQSPPVPDEEAHLSIASRTSRDSSFSSNASSLYNGGGMSPTVIDDSSRRSSAVW